MNGTQATSAMLKTCRVCGQAHLEPGILCATHRTQLTQHLAHQNTHSDAITDRRIWTERAARQASPRTEWIEVV